MPNSTFWGLRWCHGNAFMPTNSTFWGLRWCRIAMRTCYSALTMPLHCVNDLRTIQDGGVRVLSGWNGVDDSTKPFKFPLTCLIPRLGLEMVPYSDANVLQCTYSAHTLCGWPQYYPKWVREEVWVGEEMAWMTVPSRPRSQLHAQFHIFGLEVVLYSDANVL